MSFLHQARFGLIDTSSINLCARDPDGTDAILLNKIVREGAGVPFLTYHQLEEVAQHENEEVFRSRMAFLGKLASVAYCPETVHQASIGSVLDLREHEIRYLLDHPTATHEEVIAGVGSLIRGGFCTGGEFVAKSIDFLDFFRKGLTSGVLAQKVEIANLGHFPLTNMRERLDFRENLGKKRPAHEMVALINQKKQEMINLIRERGDTRAIDVEAFVEEEMKQYVENAQRLADDPEGFLAALLRDNDVDVDRLPKNPTVEDAGNEAVFVANTRTHARRMGIDHSQLIQSIRKESLPSWVVWQELQRRSRSLRNAEAGNVDDRHLACFGPYVDVLNVDKRTKECLRQSATDTQNPFKQLMTSVYLKVPEKAGLQGFVQALEDSAPPSASAS